MYQTCTMILNFFLAVSSLPYSIRRKKLPQLCRQDQSQNVIKNILYSVPKYAVFYNVLDRVRVYTIHVLQLYQHQKESSVILL